MPLCLPDTMQHSPSNLKGKGVSVQGWGKNKDSKNGIVGQALTQIDVVVKSQRYCNYQFKNPNNVVSRMDPLRIRAYLPELITDNMFCAESPLNRDKVGVCSGDSGGPTIISG